MVSKITKLCPKKLTVRILRRPDLEAMVKRSSAAKNKQPANSTEEVKGVDANNNHVKCDPVQVSGLGAINGDDLDELMDLDRLDEILETLGVPDRIEKLDIDDLEIQGLLSYVDGPPCPAAHAENEDYKRFIKALDQCTLAQAHDSTIQGQSVEAVTESSPSVCKSEIVYVNSMDETINPELGCAKTEEIPITKKRTGRRGRNLPTRTQLPRAVKSTSVGLGPNRLSSFYRALRQKRNQQLVEVKSQGRNYIECKLCEKTFSSKAKAQEHCCPPLKC